MQAAWHTAGSVAVTRAPLPDDRLGTALLPLRVAGKTDGQRQVLAAAEQMVVALRSVFACDPQPRPMRAAGRRGRRGGCCAGCDNLADVLYRTRTRVRHPARAAGRGGASAGCAGPVATDLAVEDCGDGTVRAVLDRGDGPPRPSAGWATASCGISRLALVLLTGPGVLAVDPAAEVPVAPIRR